MSDQQKDRNNPTGMGPGVTGASGDLIDGTGGDSGIGGSGHADHQSASGGRSDERQQPGQGDVMHEDAEPHTARQHGSQSGTVGGGGPVADPSGSGEEGRPGGGGSGALGDVPGGIRQVSPANDKTPTAEIAHEDENAR
jgi:hypothetical protein